MIDNLLNKLKAWEEIENRAIDIFNIYRTEICKKDPNNKVYRYLDYIDVNFERNYIVLNFDEILPGDYNPYCDYINIPFEYFSGEKDVKEYLENYESNIS